MDDQNSAADSITKSFHDFINGDAFVQGLKDAWNKHFGSSTPAQGSHEQAMQDMNKQANAHNNDSANQSFIKPDVAAKIRAKANGK